MNSPGKIMDCTVAGRSVRDSWALAEAAHHLIPTGDERWSLPPEPRPSNWIKTHRDADRNCRFQMVLFEHVYRRQSVPAGCETFFKVKVTPRTLRELVAVYEAGDALPYTYKCGLDAGSPITSGIYGAYFYLHGLPAARAAYARVREAVDAHPKLGPEVPVYIKQGCTEYEVHCGPSDRYTFSDEQRELEAGLRELIQIAPAVADTKIRIQQTFAHCFRTAYRLGDDSYLDFTGGRRLYPAVVKYAPGESVAAHS